MNPLLPSKYFIPDCEAHVMPDGRLYLYGSMDYSGKKEYCGNEYRVFSTADPMLENWTDHGISFKNTTEEPGIPWKQGIPLYAPDAIHSKGKYYLYICGQDAFEAVAVSDKPYGPFTDAKPIKYADGDSIDPAIFIDGDGQAYYLWGQFSLKGAKLNSDMSTLDESSITKSILTEQEHGFHEGASLRKHNDKYYIIYTDISRGKATCMSYAYSDKPLGPYKKVGIIIDNIYCDPCTWNNHGSIEEFCGQWYVFYHRSSQNGYTCRRVCAEPIYFNEDGTINEVKMTSQGPSHPIDAFKKIEASVACRLKGNVYIKPLDDSGEKEMLTNCGGGNWTYDWAEYRYIDFGTGANGFEIKALGKGKISIMTEGGLTVGVCEIDCDTYKQYRTTINNITGVKAIWLLFDGKNISVTDFIFYK